MEVFWAMIGSVAIGLGAAFSFWAVSKNGKPKELEACSGDMRVVEVRLENGEAFYHIEVFREYYPDVGGCWVNLNQKRYDSEEDAQARIDEIKGLREVSRKVIERAA
jgi:hypothetical protein